MQVSVASPSELERVLTVTVPAAELTNEYNVCVKNFAKKAKIDGFRKGKIPLDVAKKMYGAQAFQEAIKSLVDKNTFEAFKQTELLVTPGFSVEVKTADFDKDLVYDVKAELFPVCKLADFSTIELEQTKCEITEADVDSVIDKVRHQSGQYVEADNEYKTTKHDRVKADLTIKEEGENKENKGVTISLLELPEDVQKNYLDHKVGDEFDYSFSFGEGDKKQTREFHVVILEVKKMILPELNEAFFKKVGAKENTLESFRADVRSNMEREKKFLLQNINNRAVNDALMKAHEFPLPQKYIEFCAKDAVDREMKKNASNKRDSYKLGMDYYVRSVTNYLKLTTINNAIVKANDIKVTDELIKSYVADVSSAYEDADEVQNYYMSNPTFKERVSEQCLSQLIAEYVVKNSKVTEKSVSFEELTTQNRM